VIEGMEYQKREANLMGKGNIVNCDHFSVVRQPPSSLERGLGGGEVVFLGCGRSAEEKISKFWGANDYIILI
jgi:hypothetical protein